MANLIHYVRELFVPSFHLCNRKKMRRLNSSSSSINDLPLETLLEILYKVLVKQLHRNKIVCKFWSSLISNPSFRSEYSARRRPHSNTPTHNTLYLNYLYSNKVFSVVLSNGLLLCTSYDHSQRFLYLVCNPTTKHWLALPAPPTNRKIVLSGFVCNPNSESSNGATQFKVVQIVSRTSKSSVIDSKVLSMEIFDSATNQYWRVLKRTIDDTIRFNRRVDAIELKGILYWESKISHAVVSFDPNSYLCLRLPLPESYGEGVQHVFGASRDHLYYVEIDFGFTSPFTMWKCDESEGEYTWTVHHTFDLEWIHDEFKPRLSLFYWLFYYRSFNPEDGDWKVLVVDPVDCNVLYLFAPLEFDGLHRIYSLNVETRKMKKLRYFSIAYGYVKQATLFVQPSWPTSLPRIKDFKKFRQPQLFESGPIKKLYGLEVKRKKLLE